MQRIRLDLAIRVLMLAVAMVCAAPAWSLSAAVSGDVRAVQGTGISYQGELLDVGVLANGNYDLRFRLFDALTGGALVGTPDTLTFSNQTVSAGLFNLVLDFGTDAFAGDARFLEIGVRPGGSAVAFTVLNPRQAITAAPYAVHALTAGRATPRSFYLTTTTHLGNAATTACAAGFHMASMWEIHDVATLQYDTTRGFSATDSGSGAPASVAGWIRTGVPSFTNTVPGNANCNAWTSSNAAHNGTRINLQPQWSEPADFTAPWDATVQACGTSSRVWCVED
jgi:hypothetical protein